MVKNQKAFFLDRDGTINVDYVYISDPARIELIENVAQAIKMIKDAGYLVIVVTNQSGVGRGIITPEVLPKINRRLNDLVVAEVGVGIDEFKNCLHTPADKCRCRKPGTLLVEEAVASWGIDLAQSVFVGDKMTDVLTGVTTRCRFSILVKTGKGEFEKDVLRDENGSIATPDFLAEDLLSAVKWVFQR